MTKTCNIIISNTHSLSEGIERLARNCSSIKFYNSGYYNINLLELHNAIKKLPQNLTNLDLGNLLKNKSTQNLQNIFATLSQHRTIDNLALTLTSERFINVSFTTIDNTFKILPDFTTSLNLDTALRAIPDNILANVFSVLPTSIKKLDLSNNNLYEKRYHLLKQCISNLPRNLEELNLSFNNLGIFFKCSQIANILQELPALKFLNLSFNALNNTTDTNQNISLKIIFSHLPDSVETLDLSNNALGYIQYIYETDNESVFSFNTLKNSVKNLNISNNNLDELSEPELINLIESIPDSVEMLDISGNNLQYKILNSVLCYLPSSITHLKLNNNFKEELNDNNVSGYFSIFERYAISAIFHSLPSSIVTLELNDNNFGKCPDSLMYLLSSIPKTVSTIDISTNELFTGLSGMDCDKLLGKLSPYRDKLILTDNGEEDFQRALVALMSGDYPLDISLKMLTFLNDNIPDNIARFFTEPRVTIEHVDEIIDSQSSEMPLLESVSCRIT